jgi:hypothetical protein
VPSKGAGHRVYRITALCLRDGDTVVGAATLVHDVTGEARSHAREQVLSAAHREIGTTLSATRTSQEVATTLTRDFADAVSVDLVGAVLDGGDPPAAPLTPADPLRRTAFEAPGGLEGVHAVGEPSRFVFPTPTRRFSRIWLPGWLILRTPPGSGTTRLARARCARHASTP